MPEISWLHLSDLHCGAPGHLVRWPEVQVQVLADLKKLSERYGKPDLLIFTGDLAYSGQKDQFAELDRVLGQIRDALDADPVLLPVPGNHDLCRPSTGGMVESYLSNYLVNENTRPAFKRGSDPETQRNIAGIFGEYDKWFASSVLPKWDSRRLNFRLGRLPGDYLLTFKKDNFRLGIAGANASFLHISDAKKRVVVEPEQIAVEDLHAWSYRHHGCLLLVHHPIEDFDPVVLNELNRDVLAGDRFFSVLCGHKHKHHSSKDKMPYRIQSTSLFGLSEYGTKHEKRAMGYSWCRLTLNSDKIAQLHIDRRTEDASKKDRVEIISASSNGTGPIEIPLRSIRSEGLRVCVIACTSTRRNTRDNVAARLWLPGVRESHVLPAEDVTANELQLYDIAVIILGPTCNLSLALKAWLRGNHDSLHLIPGTIISEPYSDFWDLMKGVKVQRFADDADAAESANRFVGDFMLARSKLTALAIGSTSSDEVSATEIEIDSTLTRAKGLSRTGKDAEAVEQLRGLLKELENVR